MSASLGRAERCPLDPPILALAVAVGVLAAGLAVLGPAPSSGAGRGGVGGIRAELPLAGSHLLPFRVPRGDLANVRGTFPGLNASSTPCGCLPADPSLAVGPNDSLEMTEGAAAIFSAGLVPLSVEPLPTFFGAPAGHGLSHPQATFDGAVQRYIAAALDPVAGVVRLAASDGPNASGAWHTWSLSPNGSFLLASLGLASAGSSIGLSLTATNRTTGLPAGSELWVLSAAGLATGAIPANESFGPSGIPPGAAPVPSTSGPLYFVAASGGGALLEQVAGAPPSATLSAQGLTMPAELPPVPIAQPGGPKMLMAPNASSITVGAAAGRLDLARTVSNGSADFVELAAWNLSTGALEEAVRLGNGTNVFAPGLALDAAGDAVVVANAADPGTNLSLVIFAQPANELNVTPPSQLLAQGVPDAGLLCPPSHLCAWANLSAAVRDPVDPADLWVAGAYDDGTGPNWTTELGLTVAPALSAGLLTSDRATGDVGVPVNFTVVAVGGIAPYGYAWNAAPSLGCSPSAAPRLACRPTAPGILGVSVQISDAGGRHVTATANFTVSGAPSFAFLRANRSSADVGQNVSFLAGGTGGLPPYGVTWQTPPAARCAPPGPAIVNCTFVANGSFRIDATITDQNGASVTNATQIEVYPLPQIVDLAADPSPPRAGEPFNLSFGIVGGSGGARVVWAGLPRGCASANATHLTCTPTAAGGTNVTVDLVDSNGGRASASLGLVVGPAPSNPSGPLLSSTEIVEIALAVAAAIALAAVLYPRRPRRPEAVETEPIAPPEAPPALPPAEEPAAGGPAPGEAP